MTERRDGVAECNRIIAESIPRVWDMGVRYVEIKEGYAVAEVPVAGNANHVGTVYAGVLFTVAEVLGGGVARATFDMDGFYPVVKSARIDFVRPATSRVRASACLDAASIPGLRREAAERGKAEFELSAELVDDSGALVGRMTGTYQVRRAVPGGGQGPRPVRTDE